MIRPDGQDVLVVGENFDLIPIIWVFKYDRKDSLLKNKKIIEIPDFKTITCVSYASSATIMIGTHCHLIIMEDQGYQYQVKKIFYNLFTGKLTL